MKSKIEVKKFGRIVEEIPSSKFDCAMTHIYINNLSDDAMIYLTDLIHRLPAEELQSYMVHYDDYTENLLEILWKYKRRLAMEETIIEKLQSLSEEIKKTDKWQMADGNGNSNW